MEIHEELYENIIIIERELVLKIEPFICCMTRKNYALERFVARKRGFGKITWKLERDFILNFLLYFSQKIKRFYSKNTKPSWFYKNFTINLMVILSFMGFLMS